MNNYTKKILIKEIQNLTLPFDFSLKYFNENTDEITDKIIGNVIYVYITITNKQCSKLKNSYNTSIYFLFNDSYPILPPTIYLEDKLIHPLVNNGDTILLCDYNPAIRFRQLILNVYCIILEGLENNRNKKLIKIINNDNNNIINDNNNNNNNNNYNINDNNIYYNNINDNNNNNNINDNNNNIIYNDNNNNNYNNNNVKN